VEGEDGEFDEGGGPEVEEFEGEDDLGWRGKSG